MDKKREENHTRETLNILSQNKNLFLKDSPNSLNFTYYFVFSKKLFSKELFFNFCLEM